jgi:hypothetical protein
MKANETQVGGDHYKIDGLQHWDYCTIVQADYLQGYASKYIVRWRKMPKEKGVQDLQKSAHIIRKMWELATTGWGEHITVSIAGGRVNYRNNCYATLPSLKRFTRSNGIESARDQAILGTIFLWRMPRQLTFCIDTINELIEEVKQ